MYQQICKHSSSYCHLQMLIHGHILQMQIICKLLVKISPFYKLENSAPTSSESLKYRQVLSTDIVRNILSVGWPVKLSQFIGTSGSVAIGRCLGIDYSPGLPDTWGIPQQWAKIKQHTSVIKKLTKTSQKA